MRAGYNFESRAERSTSIDVLKGIGIISVVIGHAMNTDNYYSGSVELIRRFVYLYHLVVFSSAVDTC